MEDIRNPNMARMEEKTFRAWVCERFDSMAEDRNWQLDNAALVPQARRIAYAASKDQPVSLADAKVIAEEVADFEDVLREDGLWMGAKMFLVESKQVRELTAEEASKIVVSRGRPEWFKHKGKMYV